MGIVSVCASVSARLFCTLAIKAYGPWRACASVCLLARVWCVCVCSTALHSACMHRAAQVLVLVLVHAVCAARALRA